MALLVVVVKVLAGMITLYDGDVGAAKVAVGSIRPPLRGFSSRGFVHEGGGQPSVSAPRSTTIHSWYVTALATKLKVGLAVHVPLKTVVNTFWDGLVPKPL